MLMPDYLASTLKATQATHLGLVHIELRGHGLHLLSLLPQVGLERGGEEGSVGQQVAW